MENSGKRVTKRLEAGGDWWTEKSRIVIKYREENERDMYEKWNGKSNNGGFWEKNLI